MPVRGRGRGTVCTAAENVALWQLIGCGCCCTKIENEDANAGRHRPGERHHKHGGLPAATVLERAMALHLELDATAWPRWIARACSLRAHSCHLERQDRRAPRGEHQEKRCDRTSARASDACVLARLIIPHSSMRVPQGSSYFLAAVSRDANHRAVLPSVRPWKRLVC